MSFFVILKKNIFLSPLIFMLLSIKICVLIGFAHKNIFYFLVQYLLCIYICFVLVSLVSYILVSVNIFCLELSLRKRWTLKITKT